MVAMPDNPLQALFWRAWTTEGFATSLADDPHVSLAKHGLPLAREIALAIFGWREQGEHLCPSCQLAVPGVYMTIGPASPIDQRERAPVDAPVDASVNAPASSALNDVFVHASDPSFLARGISHPREVLAELGLALTDNVRVRIASGASPSLELQLCEGFHACMCDTPDLHEQVSAMWRAIYDR